MADKSCVIKEDGKVYGGERLVVDFHRLQGWSTLSSRQVRIWTGVAKTLAINDFSQLSECDTAQWWLALCGQEGGRACAKSHIERLAASQLRFKDWSPARERTLLDRDMTASNRWGRALGVLTDGGVHYSQQLSCLSDSVLLEHVPGLRSGLLQTARYAVQNSEA